MDVTQIAQFIWAASALFLIILVILHSPKGDGIGGIGGQAQLFTSAKTAETTLNRITWLLSVIFMSLTVALSAGWLGTPSVNVTPPDAITQPDGSAPLVPITPDAPDIPQTLPADE